MNSRDPRATTSSAVALSDRPDARPPAPRSGSPRARKVVRPLPERDSAYGHLDLDALRQYRVVLQAEEGKVSYWRRILQGRLDAVQGLAASPVEGATLAPVLSDARVSSGRTALVEILPVDDIPPLPSLAELWDRRVASGDEVGQAALLADLLEAEQQLSAYRSALHRRIAGATGELIARYRECPTLCLVALPLHRDGRGPAAV